MEVNNRKYLGIALCYVLACFVLYLFGVLYIQFMLFLAAVALFPVLIIHEKSNLNRLVSDSDLSADERWSKKKKQLDKIQDNLEKTRNSEERKSLQSERRSLENELRQIEWKLREADMTELYNASRGNLRKIRDIRDESFAGKQTKESEHRKILSEIVKESQRILDNEPPSSQRESLIPLTNNLRAHCNLLKRKGSQGYIKNLQADYFVTWGCLSSFTNGVRIDARLVNYASPKLRKSLLKLVRKVVTLQANPSYRSSSNDIEFEKSTEV